MNKSIKDSSADSTVDSIHQHKNVRDEITRISLGINLRDLKLPETSSDQRRKNLLIDISRNTDAEVSIGILQGFPEEPEAMRILGASFWETGRFVEAKMSFQSAANCGDIHARYALLMLLQRGEIELEHEQTLLDELSTLSKSGHTLYEAIQAGEDYKLEKFDSALAHCIRSLENAHPDFAKSTGISISIIIDILERTKENIAKENTQLSQDEVLIDAYIAVNRLISSFKRSGDESTHWHISNVLELAARIFKEELLVQNYLNAGILPIFQDYYRECMSIYYPVDVHQLYGLFYNQDDGSLVFKVDNAGGFGVLTPAEIGVAILSALEFGSFQALNYASSFFEANGMPIELLEKYELEWESWGCSKYFEE